MLKHYALMNAWKDDPFKELSISQIMKLNHKKTKPWTFLALQQLAKQKMLTKKRISNIDLYSLNWANPKSAQTIQVLTSQQKLQVPPGLIEDIYSTIPQLNYTLLLFGSYANNTQQKDSDIDLCFLIPGKQAKQKISPFIEEIKLRHKETLHIQFITYEDFTEMLLRKEENLGKQIARNNVAIYNADTYYKLLYQAHTHGFRF